MFKIEISTENAAFMDPITGEPNPYVMESEIIRIITEQVLPNLRNGYTDKNLRDINGNAVGRMVIV